MLKDFVYSEKKIYDSVHGFIPFDELEKELIDSLPFQRLHYIHQLGSAYLVYPGATHTRFEHSLGVMHLATLMFEKICKTVRPDVFQFVPRKGSSEYLYWKRILRLAALCHDLGHLPFSHVAEKALLGPQGHESWTLKIIDSEYLVPIWKKLNQQTQTLQDLTGRNCIEDVKKISVGERVWFAETEQKLSPWEKIVSELITGDFFGADRIDYLLRDSKSTGVAYGIFDYHQLIEMLRILPSADLSSQDLQLGIDANGIESCEALLLARHFMHRRVYQYSSVKAYNFHLRRYMKELKILQNLTDVEAFLSISDTDVISSLNKAAKDPLMPGHHDAKCVIFRKHRFRAIALPDAMTKQEMKRFQDSHNIPKEEIYWEIMEDANPPDRLAFPVSRRHTVVQRAEDCSDLLLRVPSKKKSSWVYISPKYDLPLIQFLEQLLR